MLRNLRVNIRYFLFWILFFFVERLIFLLLFTEKLYKVALSEIAGSFYYGLRLDVSTIGYLSVLPALGFVLYWNIPLFKLPSKVFRIYIRTVIVICALISVINFNIYREWGAKVNYRAFDFLFNSPGEALASSFSSPLLLSFFVLGLLVLFGFYLSAQMFRDRLNKQGSAWIKIPLSILLLGLNFLAIRGGWQLAPANESMAYYSSVPFLNHAAVNTEWALMRSFKNVSNTGNPFRYYNQTDEARKIVSSLYAPAEPNPVKILTSDRPNVVFIVLESFTADVVESLGGEKGINPVMEEMISEGVLFNQIYSSGDRTDRGLVAILSGFPTQATRSIIKESSKNTALPSVYETFNKFNYHSSFYYGGESEFANIKSYLLNNGCETIVDKSNFSKKDMNSKWGAYDHVVFNRFLSKPANSTPFCSVILTLTNHEPFELPGQSRFKGVDNENKFRSTAFYTDSSLGAFIASAKGKPWYSNTLFVVVADHGHRLPKNQFEAYDPRRFRIPLLLFGDVIKPDYRGIKISKTGSQTDIVATLFNQLNMPFNDYKWSKDLLNPSVEGHAFFTWDNGFGFVDDENQALSFDNTGRSVIYRSEGLEAKREQNMLRIGKAYMQSVFQQYLEY